MSTLKLSYNSNKEQKDREISTNNCFMVFVKEKKYSCSKVSNLVVSTDVENLKEGGINDHPIILKNQTASAQTLQFEGAVFCEKRSSSIEEFKVGEKLKEITIAVIWYKKVVRVYCIDEGIVTKKEITSLDAINKEIMTVKLEIAHTGLRDTKFKQY